MRLPGKKKILKGEGKMITKLIMIVHELRKASGTNKKKEILLKHKDNELWKMFLQYTLDGSIAYHVSAPKTHDFDIVDIDKDLFKGLDLLRLRSVTGKAAKKLTLELSAKYGEIARLALAHTLKAGVSFKTVNSVYDNLILVFESLKGKDVPIPKYPVISSIKYDGVKVFVFVTPTGNYLTTSSGAKFKLKSLEKEFEGAVFGVYEGELIHGKGRQVDRPVITGKLNSLLAGTIDDIDGYSYMVYDYITHVEWDSNTGVNNFKQRYIMLDSAFINFFLDSMYVKMVEQVQHTTEEEVIRYNEDLIEAGYEGSMHRYPEDLYAWERVDYLIKKKSIRECVLTCVGTVKHSNPAKGNTGSLICAGDINDKIAGKVTVSVNVGSGLSKTDILRESDYYTGEQIEVLYNSVTETEEGFSLFLPRFKRVVR